MSTPIIAYATFRVLFQWLRGVQVTPPSSVYVGLMTQAPNQDGTGVIEPNVGNYQRRQVTLSEPAINAGVMSVRNLNALVFPTATVDWPQVSHLGVFSNGNELLFYGPLAAPRTIKSGDALSLAEGALQLRLK